MVVVVEVKVVSSDDVVPEVVINIQVEVVLSTVDELEIIFEVVDVL